MSQDTMQASCEYVVRTVYKTISNEFRNNEAKREILCGAEADVSCSVCGKNLCEENNHDFTCSRCKTTICCTPACITKHGITCPAILPNASC